MRGTKLRDRLEERVLRGNARLSRTASIAGNVMRLFTDRDFTVRAARYLLGLPVSLDTEDRRILKQVIFPYFLALPTTRDVLFVGCGWYTRHYERAFFAACNYWTLDVAPRARKHGARQHIIAPLERLSEYFSEGSFDLIVCNGVFGFGLDTREQCERAFADCHSRLRSTGHFVLGWTDIPARTPLPLETIESLSRFQKFDFPAFGAWRYLTATPYRHTYEFYRK